MPHIDKWIRINNFVFKIQSTSSLEIINDTSVFLEGKENTEEISISWDISICLGLPPSEVTFLFLLQIARPQLLPHWLPLGGELASLHSLIWCMCYSEPIWTITHSSGPQDIKWRLNPVFWFFGQKIATYKKRSLRMDHG